MQEKYYSTSFDGKTATISALVRESGEDLLLFLHGLGCSKESFRYFWSQPKFEAYSAIAIDFPGFGGSRASDSFRYTMEDHAQATFQILRNHLGQRVHVVAHSMGCAVALLFPTEILNSLASFTCIEGNLIGADCGVVSHKVANTNPEKFASEVFPVLQKQLFRAEGGYFALESSDPAALYQSAVSLVTWSDSEKLLDKFQALPCRKVYIYGEENASLETVGRVTNVSKIEIKNSGHFPMRDNPDNFYTELEKFLAA